MWHYLQVTKKEGLIPSAYIKEKTETYKKELDVVKGWVSANLEADGRQWVSVKKVFDKFVNDNQEDADLKFMKQSNFTGKLPTNLILQLKYYDNKQQTCIMGFVLRSDDCDIIEDYLD
jgi:hypothetical protein